MARAKVKTGKNLPKPRAEDLLRWYDAHGRSLPWRTKKGARPDPYHVWLSEIMLQQTTVTTVIPYYQRFLHRWPNIEALAEADLQDVLAAWAGLGYYRRAHNLHSCARRLVAEQDGAFPETEEKLRKLPGIGDYTAAAMAAIAFDRPANVVDGNVERVMARIHQIPLPLPQAKPHIRRLAALLLPVERRHGDYAQALMDLGATICTPRQPACPRCPWQKNCGAHENAQVEAFPVPARRKTKPARHGIAFWLENGQNEVWLRRRADTGLLAGMMEFPSSPWTETMPDMAETMPYAPCDRPWQPLPQPISHSFTHFDLYLQVMYSKTSRIKKRARGNGRWADIRTLETLALPSVMRKIALVVLKWRKA